MRLVPYPYWVGAVTGAVDGQRVTVPSGIAIDIKAPIGITKTPSLDGTTIQYFVTLCAAPCLSPLHTHDPTGLIHTESKKPKRASSQIPGPSPEGQPCRINPKSFFCARVIRREVRWRKAFCEALLGRP